MAKGTSGEQLTATGRFALTGRILAVNILPLLIMGGGLLYLDSYRTQLINERFKLARIEAQITAEALAGVVPRWVKGYFGLWMGLCVAALFIPLPHAIDDHQRANAHQ